MHFTPFLGFLVAASGLVVAAPSEPTQKPVIAAFGGENKSNVTTLVSQSGCGSSGPLGNGHYKWWIVVSCTPGSGLTCQATDASGCVPGDVKHIGSMEVDDPDDTFNVATGRNTNTLQFTCPSGGAIRCEANFNDSYDGPNYSLRVF